jgi:hypothetical protein
MSDESFAGWRIFAGKCCQVLLKTSLSNSIAISQRTPSQRSATDSSRSVIAFRVAATR